MTFSSPHLPPARSFTSSSSPAVLRPPYHLPRSRNSYAPKYFRKTLADASAAPLPPTLLANHRPTPMSAKLAEIWAKFHETSPDREVPQRSSRVDSVHDVREPQNPKFQNVLGNYMTMTRCPVKPSLKKLIDGIHPKVLRPIFSLFLKFGQASLVRVLMLNF